jgi:hypothetical protein
VFLILIAVILAVNESSGVKLELTRRNMFDILEDGRAIEIVNAGTKPIKIAKIIINDRADCSAEPFGGYDYKTTAMKVGDKFTVVSSCLIIRANVETDQGSETYSFNR